jgi:hypothetical protein
VTQQDNIDLTVLALIRSGRVVMWTEDHRWLVLSPDGRHWHVVEAEDVLENYPAACSQFLVAPLPHNLLGTPLTPPTPCCRSKSAASPRSVKAQGRGLQPDPRATVPHEPPWIVSPVSRKPVQPPPSQG